MSELNIPANFFEQTINGFAKQGFAMNSVLQASSEAKEIINSFMADMQEYIRTNKAPNLFCSTIGLYGNLELKVLGKPVHIVAEVTLTFSNILKANFGENRIPFNECYSDFQIECHQGTRYLNPKRLTFIQNWKPL